MASITHLSPLWPVNCWLTSRCRTGATNLRCLSRRSGLTLSGGRLLDDVRAVLNEVGRRHDEQIAEVYPEIGGRRPWGYLWASTLPCQECGRRFPLTGAVVLRHPKPATGDPGQHYCVDVDRQTGTFRATVHAGALPVSQPYERPVAARQAPRAQSAHSATMSTPRRCTDGCPLRDSVRTRYYSRPTWTPSMGKLPRAHIRRVRRDPARRRTARYRTALRARDTSQAG